VIFTGVPRATVSARQAKRRATVVVAGALSGPVLALMALSAAVGHRGSATSPSTMPIGHDRGFAQLAAEDYLAARPTLLPFVQGLDASLGRDAARLGVAGSGATPLGPGGANMAGGPAALSTTAPIWRSALEGIVSGRSYEIDTFVVATPTALWHLDVEVIDSPAGPVIGADPSLEPDPMAPANSEGALTYSGPGGVQGNPGPGALRQVQAWARAYVEGDGATLYRLTGDVRTDSYPSLQGWVLDRVSLDSSAVRAGVALAQVHVVMHRSGNPAMSLSSSYDLMLGALSQSLPFVQAWGPAGSGPSLVAYQNALPVPNAPVS